MRGAADAIARDGPPAANEPLKRRRVQHDLAVVIVPLPQDERRVGSRLFWELVGDLAADVLLDNVEGPWGASDRVDRARVAA